jgi:CrcB protein
MLRDFLLVSMGSFLGGGSRFIVSKVIQAWAPLSFPLGTFAVNIVGCLIIGILSGLHWPGGWMSPSMKLVLTTGFCGGFTTFSTFMNESTALMRDGNYLYFALYIGLSVALGLIAVVAGNACAKMI